MCISINNILGYGVICKNNPKCGLVSIEVGPDGHLICHSGHFFCHSDMWKIWRAQVVFLCQVMCCAWSPPHAHPLSSLEEEEGEGEIPAIVVGWWHYPAAMQHPLWPTTEWTTMTRAADMQQEGWGGRQQQVTRAVDRQCLELRLLHSPKTLFQDDTNNPCNWHSSLPSPLPLCIVK